MKRSDLGFLFVIALVFLALGYGLVRTLFDQQAEIHVSDLARFDTFDQKMVNFIAASQIEDEGAKVVVPTSIEHLYMRAEQWKWYPDLEVSSSHNYTLHIASGDIQHSFHLEKGATGAMIDILIQPNKEYEIHLKDLKEGIYAIGCTEYCGIEHNKMRGRLIVTK